jgi:fructose/tagatose bisphosphate aldolase
VETGTAGRDVEVETGRLHALVDGLAVHAAMRPDLNTPERMRAVIIEHLDELAKPLGSAHDQDGSG